MQPGITADGYAVAERVDRRDNVEDESDGSNALEQLRLCLVQRLSGAMGSAQFLW